MTMNMYRTSLLLLLCLAGVTALAPAQSGREYRRTAIMNGNQVRTVFGNWGVIGQPPEQGHRGAWKNDNNGYLGDVSPLVGAEVKQNGGAFHSVVTCPVDRPTARRDQDQSGQKYWTFEPVAGYFNANQQRIAMSNDPASWPSVWPDKMGDPSDPGWHGSWNGYFGKRSNADLETYYVMDDNNDERFNYLNNNTIGVAFKPDANNLSRNGLALEMRVRGLQWAQFLAKDNIFWLYEITNTGTTNYDRAVFGMIVGTYVGVTSTENYQEYADDWSFYDVNTNLTYTGDYGRSTQNPLWVGPIGMVGYAFLESPGNPFDGLDNDGDADSSATGRAAPRFTASSFDTTTLFIGQQIVLVNEDYSRTVFTIPLGDSTLVTTRGLSRWIFPGKTRVVEGNIVRDAQGNEIINPNAYDGIDNDFDGLIDENFFLHYRQIKRTRTVPPVTLIDILRPVRYVNFATGQGTSDLSMIDEKRNDRVDNNQDWNIAFDDLGRDGIPGTGDAGEGDGQPTSGYDMNGNDTGLPGEQHIDKTDVRESDQIGLTSFFYFVGAVNVSLGDDESLWRQLQPGYFDVPSSIVNNRPQAGADGDFIYGSGYFPLRAKATERFSLALVFGGGRGGTIDDDIADLLRNKKTVQKIYDANYQFPQPPDKPTLTAVPGDHKVTLYWDRKAEASFDPVLAVKDFEGYKIYKSTKPDFSDKLLITDATGAPQGYVPLMQYDVKNGIAGPFQTTGELFQDIAGYAYFLGTDNGLQHSYVDVEVENGRQYYYAIVAYDRGDQYLGILPSENNVSIAVSITGELSYDRNIAVVTPNAKGAGYVAPGSGISLSHSTGFSTGSIAYDVLDPAAVTAHTYRIEFLDALTDAVDNNGNGLVDEADVRERERRTSFYSVRDLTDYKESFTAQDTTLFRLSRQPVVASSVTVTNAQGATLPPGSFTLDAVHGALKLPPGTHTVTYQYYPVYRSPNIQGSPYAPETKDADVFDGVQLRFANNWETDPIPARSGWNRVAYPYSFAPLYTSDLGPPVRTFEGYRRPADYRVIFSDNIIDTSYNDPILYPMSLPVNFTVLNQTENRFVDFIFSDGDGNGILSAQDELVFLEPNLTGQLQYTWDLKFGGSPDTLYTMHTGDTLSLIMQKPFNREDLFEFTTVKPTVDVALAKQDLLRVKAVPNPYVSAAEFEAPLPPGITSGRGERRIDFIHVPAGASIRIFTARGDHVVSLYHDSGIEDGTVSWNLKTKENLDVAFGVYFYVVESSVGNKTGKLAIIK